MSIDILKDRLPDYARDVKLNLSSLASEQLLTPQQRAGSFIAAALAANHAPTTRAVVDAFSGDLSPEALNAVKIAASLMAMNNTSTIASCISCTRTDYKTLPAKLRMTAMAKTPASRTRSISSSGRWSSRRSTAAACASRRMRRCCASTACRPSRSRLACASPRRFTPPPAPWRPKRP